MRSRFILQITLALCAPILISAHTRGGVLEDYKIGTIVLEDKAPSTAGSRLWKGVIPDAESYIRKTAEEVLATLYDSYSDTIPQVYRLHYSLEDVDGISAKGGGNGDISIFYSTRHIERSFELNDTSRLLFETRGVLLHELTHAFQLEPHGVGDYGNSRIFRAFIEGMADAVRLANGGFEHPNNHSREGHYLEGYQAAGYFFVWIRDNKDADFLRKFNRSAIDVNPWSFDAAIKYSLGEYYSINSLWEEYLRDTAESGVTQSSSQH